MFNSFTPCFLILQYSVHFCVILLIILQFSVIRNVTEFCNITLSCNITVFSNLLDCTYLYHLNQLYMLQSAKAARLHVHPKIVIK